MTNPITEARNAVNPVMLANDAFRMLWPSRKDWHATAGVAALGTSFLMRAVAAIIAFDDFSTDNDPHGEHDFGSFELDGKKLFWKIDCYDRSLEHASPDPADPGVTRRLMTIMLASEY